MSESSLLELDWLSGVVTWPGSLTKTSKGRKGFWVCFSSKPQWIKGACYSTPSIYHLTV